MNAQGLPLSRCCSTAAPAASSAPKVCPDFCFEVYRAPRGEAARVVSAPRVLMEGSARDRRGRDPGRLPLLRRLSDHAVDRDPRVHVDRLPQVGGVCMNAESEIEAINMVWGAAGCGVRAMIASTGQGISLMQESFAELANARDPDASS